LNNQGSLNKKIAVITVILLGMLIVGALSAPAGAAGSKDTIKSVFSDVSATDPNLPYINYLNQRTIMKGFPDGSSTLLEENSELLVKQSSGRSYIKMDGAPGVAIEYLNLELKQGTLFGALASNNQEDQKQSRLAPRLAALDSLRLLAAGEKQSLPWYKTAEKKKVKVKVDMPWGIAAIRGTFYKVSVNAGGSCKVSCLTGSAELTSSNGSTVTLGGNQSSAINTMNDNPAPADSMSQNEVDAFSREQQWIVDTSINIDTSKAVPVVEMVIEANEKVTADEKQEKPITTLR
jgi:hypothetical protein